MSAIPLIVPRTGGLPALTRAGCVAITALLMAAGALPAASIDRPLRDGISRYDGRYEADDNSSFPAPRRRLRDSEQGDPFGYEALPWRAPPRPESPRYRPSRGGSDTFGIIAPRGREKVPWDAPFEEDRAIPHYGVPLPGEDRVPYVPRRGGGPLAPSRRPAESRPPSHSQPRPSAPELIARRYEDPDLVRFIGALSAERALAMYAETLEVIEARHLSPPPVQVLVERGIENLLEALLNPAFQRMSGVAPLPQQVQAFRQRLSQMVQPMQVRNSADAVAIVQAVMQAAGGELQVSPVLAAIEFEFGALESLDRYSTFVPSETAQRTNQQLGEAMVGIGVQIERADAGLRVLKVLADGPAVRAGVRKGDLIVAVNGEPLAGRDLSSASSLIAGPEGSIVRLSIASSTGAREVAVPRRGFAVQSVTDVQMLDPAAGIGYLKLETFASGSAQEMEQALWSLQQQGMRSLVLDLRGDPGGLLTSAVAIADLFLPEGTIVTTRGRTAADNMTEQASQPQTWKVPLVLLVDENSASASEILAAAIQENGRGTVVGRHTYGKGTVQTLFPLASVAAGLRLTTAKFYSPSGREMAGVGVEPDVPVAGPPESAPGDLSSDSDLLAAMAVAEQSVRPPGADPFRSTPRPPWGNGRLPETGY